MTAPDLVEVVAKALYRSVVSFPGELHPTLSELPKRQQDKYHRQARAVLAALTEAGTVEWGSEHVRDRGIDFHDWANEETARRKVAYYGGRVVSRLTLPWTAVAE